MTRIEDMARTEVSRETEARAFEDYSFEEPNLLDIPQVVIDRFADQGLSLRWIRITLKGKDDIQNVGKRIQEGWDFVALEDVPEMAQSSVVKDEGRYSGTVCRGDVSLAMIPTHKAIARKEFYEGKSHQMMDAVNSQLMSNNDSRAPISNRSKSQVIKGRTPSFQD
jgi:hypothetical protein